MSHSQETHQRFATTSFRLPQDEQLRASVSITSRQLEIVSLVVDGLTNNEIAERLCISSRTVQSHLASIMGRLRVTTRTQLAVCALRAGMVPLHPAAIVVGDRSGSPDPLGVAA